MYNYAAKPDSIFDSQEDHDSIFNEKMIEEVDECVFRSNIHKCVRALINDYLNRELTKDGQTRTDYYELFGGKGNQRFVYAMEHLLMKISEQKVDGEVKKKVKSVLFKNPSKDLCDEIEVFFSAVIKFSKGWYYSNRETHEGELTKTALDKFVQEGYSRYLK